MRNVNRPEQGRDEDHFVKATLIVESDTVSGVPCKVYLPERIDEKPFIILKPSKGDAARLMASHKGSLHATVFGFDKERQLTIEAPKVYFSSSTTKHWGEDISDTTIHGEPQDLHIICHHLRADGDPQRTQVVFWISANPYLTPFMTSSSSYTGDLKYKPIRNLEFIIKDEVKLVFERHFRSKTAANGDFVQWSFLVAYTELDVPADDVETLKKKVLQGIDDFLLIASFATRQRTACLGWTASVLLQ